MAITTYNIDLTDDDGQPITGLAFGGLGASPGVASLAPLAGGAAIDPSVLTIASLGYGYYRIVYDPVAHNPALLVLDCGSIYTGRTRYRGILLTIRPASPQDMQITVAVKNP